jgi:hypothetical protein
MPISRIRPWCSVAGLVVCTSPYVRSVGWHIVSDANHVPPRSYVGRYDAARRPFLSFQLRSDVHMP